jgi:hypothetical protein
MLYMDEMLRNKSYKTYHINIEYNLTYPTPE